MCQNFTLLAKINHYRFINSCEHRTVHVVWHNITLSMPPSEFGHFVRLLEKMVAEPMLIKISEGNCTLIQQPDNYIQVWVANTGLIFSLADFLLLTDMARAAVRQLERAPAKTGQARPPRLNPLPKTSEIPISLN